MHAPARDWYQTACLGWSRGEWYTRIRGFRTGAELLGRYVAERRGEQDGLIFPYLYNWRQHFELALKHLILEAEALSEIDGQPPEGHNLHKLWTRCRRVLEAHQPCSNAAELDNVGAVLLELHRLDRSGQELRYPCFTDGRVTLKSVDNLSFDVIAEAFGPAANFLDAAETEVSVALDNKRDFERYLASLGP
jgi:hypothetical protein